MTPLGVFLAGEGRNELGGRCAPRPWGTEEPGVIETLLRKVRADGWSVVGSLPWAKIRKFRARGPSPFEQQTVLGLVYEAQRAKAQIVAFLRDADGDTGRRQVITDAIEKARESFPNVRVVGGTPFPVLEAWILALLGEHGTEQLSKARAIRQLESHGFEAKDTGAMVKAAQSFDRSKLPEDAACLRAWLDTAERALTNAPGPPSAQRENTGGSGVC